MQAEHDAQGFGPSNLKNVTAIYHIENTEAGHLREYSLRGERAKKDAAKPQFLHLYNWDNNSTYLIELRGINKIMKEKTPALQLEKAHVQPSTTSPPK